MILTFLQYTEGILKGLISDYPTLQDSKSRIKPLMFVDFQFSGCQSTRTTRKEQNLEETLTTHYKVPASPHVLHGHLPSIIRP